MSSIKDWSTTAVDNNDAPPDGFPEGMAPSAVNNSAREIMASVRSYYDAPEWRDWGHVIAYGSGTTFTTAAGDGDTTAIYHTNRRVRAIGAITTTIYGSISGSSHGAQTTVTVVWDSGSLVNETLAVAVGVEADTDHISYASLADIPAAIVEIESGTEMVFFQAAAPAGWTQTTAQNNRALRVVSGTGGGVGGSHGLNSPPSTTHAHTAPSHTHSIGSHNHQWYDHTFTSGFDHSWNSGGTLINIVGGTSAITGTHITTGDKDSNAGLELDYYTTNASGTTGSAGNQPTSSSTPTAFAPAYIDVITATKDA